MKKSIFFFLMMFFSLASYATDLPMDVAVLRGLDKVTGRISTFSIPVGQVGQFGKTFIVPESCYTHPPEESPENSAFLFIYEKSLKGENIELFKGWMFSSNPALSSMEHPVYDIWVLSCEKNSDLPAQEQIKEPSEPLPENTPIQKQEKKQKTQMDTTSDILTEPATLVPSAVEMEGI